MNPVSLEELGHALDNLVLTDDTRPLEPHHITISLFCQRYGMNRHTAKYRIKKLEGEGKLKSAGYRRDQNGNKNMVWELVE